MQVSTPKLCPFVKELIMKHSAFVGFPIDLRMEHRQVCFKG